MKFLSLPRSEADAELDWDTASNESRAKFLRAHSDFEAEDLTEDMIFGNLPVFLRDILKTIEL